MILSCQPGYSVEFSPHFTGVAICHKKVSVIIEMFDHILIDLMAYLLSSSNKKLVRDNKQILKVI